MCYFSISGKVYPNVIRLKEIDQKLYFGVGIQT